MKDDELETATVEEETRLSEKRRSKDLPYDIQPISIANLEDLDLSLFEEYLLASLPIEVIEENQRTMEQKLSSVRFATAINNQVNSSIYPTNLGLLVIGKDPREYISGDYIQFLRIDGTELGDPIQDQKEINGPISLILRILDEIFQAHILIATDLTSDIIEIQKPDYPLVALRQLGINAILHRNYETSEVLKDDTPLKGGISRDINRLALIKHYHSLMPMAQEAHKPIFFLKPADGAIGAHQKSVQSAYKDFQTLAKKIAEVTNIGSKLNYS